MMRAIVWLTCVAALNSTSVFAGQPPAPQAGEPIIQGLVAGQPVRLNNVEGRCSLTVGERPPVVLDMRWPCRFTEIRHQLRVEDYRQSLIFMVERSDPQPPPSRDCITDLQSVRLYKGKMEVAPVSRVAACGPLHWDQKVLIWQFDW